MIEIKELDNLRYEVIASQDINQYLQFKVKAKVRNWRTGKFTDEEVDEYIYEAIPTADEYYHYAIYKGWGIYLASAFENALTEEAKEFITKELEGDLFEGLNPDYFIGTQYEDLKSLLEFKRGILQIYTSYGKTEVLARLTQHLIRKGLKVLVLAGGTKALDEIKLRIEEKCPEVVVPEYWDDDNNFNAISPVGFCRSNLCNYDSEFFKTCDVILCDEVEFATTESMYNIFWSCINCKYFYGVGATAEEKKGRRIDIRYRIQNVESSRTREVVNIFGMSTVFRKPTDYKIRITELINYGLREIDIKVENEDAIYHEITNAILLNEEYLATLDYLLAIANKLYIPINNLAFIEQLVERYSSKYKVATITGAGYYHSVEGYITLDRLKELSSENQINLLLSTVSGFRATDFRGIDNILLTLGVKASTVLQYVGRVARQEYFNIYYITPGENYKLPIYSKTNQQQLNMIHEYYHDCIIRTEREQMPW